MAVVGCEDGTDLEVAYDRHVDEKTEHTGAEEIPETHRHQEIEGPLMRDCHAFPGTLDIALADADEIPRIEREQNQGHDFEGRESRPDRHRGARLPAEIPMMGRAEDSAHQVEDRIEIDDALGSDHRDRAE